MADRYRVLGTDAHGDNWFTYRVYRPSPKSLSQFLVGNIPMGESVWITAYGDRKSSAQGGSPPVGGYGHLTVMDRTEARNLVSQHYGAEYGADVDDLKDEVERLFQDGSVEYFDVNVTNDY